MRSTGDINKEQRARDLIAQIGTARTAAIGSGMSPDLAMKIGAEAEDVALDALELLGRSAEPAEMSRVRELASELHRLVHVPPTFEAIAYPAEAHPRSAADKCAMTAHADGPCGDECSFAGQFGPPVDFGDPNEPVKSTPVEDDAVRVETDGKQTTTPALGGDPALPVAKKRRAAEVLKPIAEWELSGADFRALPFDRAWVESQLPAFRAEQGEGVAARPRVVFAAWLGKREGAGEHKRAEAT